MSRFKENSTETTILWYDYETWGANPARDGIAQFAAVRTDLDLNPIGEPINLLCKPNCDTVVDVDAVLITGLSPLTLAATGMSEWAFAHAIHQHMSVPGTCTAGYNTIRFDDECTRYLFYRNLIDPYTREWQNGNSRWDLLDVIRMMSALRPEGLQWPMHDTGVPSFKLEHLTAANGLNHAQAHDAVSDVLATIALAKSVKQLHPKLFDYAFKLRSKHEVLRKMDVSGHSPHLHFTGKIAASEHCLGIEIPLFQMKNRSNEVVVLDIRQDPTWLLEHTPEQLQQWLYQKTADLPEGIQRPPFRTVHINKSPMIAPMSLLDDEVASRLNMNKARLTANLTLAQQNINAFITMAEAMFTTSPFEPPIDLDPEHALYQGFIGKHDRQLLDQLTANSSFPTDWLTTAESVIDSRLPELIENVVGRHFNDAFNDKQRRQWQAGVRKKLLSSTLGSALTLEQALAKIDALPESEQNKTSVIDTKTYLKQLSDTWLSCDNATVSEGQQLDLF